jgi:hypothetical protein
MGALLIIAIIATAGMVLYSLIRGLIYFGKTSDALTNGEGPSPMHIQQNKMMFARVKWQAITVVLLVVLSMLATAQ